MLIKLLFTEIYCLLNNYFSLKCQIGQGEFLCPTVWMSASAVPTWRTGETNHEFLWISWKGQRNNFYLGSWSTAYNCSEAKSSSKFRKIFTLEKALLSLSIHNLISRYIYIFLNGKQKFIKKKTNRFNLLCIYMCIKCLISQRLQEFVLFKKKKKIWWVSLFNLSFYIRAPCYWHIQSAVY